VKPHLHDTEPAEGNTEGRPATMQDSIRAYIAGFLDGDGSVHFQLVRRHDYVYGYQIRASVCFYQSTREERVWSGSMSSSVADTFAIEPAQ
jgi:hypothetical protein